MTFRRFLDTTGAAYYGTATFDFPVNLYAAAPVALAPGAQVYVGYDFMCLVKDIRKTNCHGLQISVWSVMTCLSAFVMVFCIVLIPIACIYRSGRFAGQGINKLFGGKKKFPEYEEIDKNATANSQEMPMPGQYRQGPNYNHREDEYEEDWED